MLSKHSELVHFMVVTGLVGSALVTSLYSNWLWLALLIPAWAFSGLIFLYVFCFVICTRKQLSKHQTGLFLAAGGLSFFLVLLMPYMYTYVGKKVFFLVLGIPFTLFYMAAYEGHRPMVVALAVFQAVFREGYLLRCFIWRLTRGIAQWSSRWWCSTSRCYR